MRSVERNQKTALQTKLTGVGGALDVVSVIRATREQK